MKKRYARIVLSVVLTLLISACGSKTSSSTTSSVPLVATLNTDQTDKLTLAESDFVDKEYTTDYIGEVTLTNCVDGDTADFRTKNGTNVVVRFVGIDTPESTAKVQPWGRAASEFTKNALRNAESVVLETEVAVSGLQDNNGRYLSWVWYKPRGGTQYRLLNLELVEQAYAKERCEAYSKYYRYFVAGRDNAHATKKRIYGEKDPRYDYNFQGVYVSCYDVMKHTAEYEGRLAEITGLIVAASAYSVYIRDLEPTILDDGTAHYFGTYIYGGHSNDLTAFAKPGRIITLRANVNEFHNSAQLSGARTNGKGEDAYTIISKDNPIETIKLDPAKDLSIYYGSVVQSEVVVEEIRNDVVYGTIAGTDTKVSMYANFNLYPAYNFNKIQIGATYLVTAGFHPRFVDEDLDAPEVDYCMTLINNANSDYHNFKLKEKE